MVQPSAAFETFKTLIRRRSAGLVGAFAVLTVARLIFQTPQWVVAYMQYDALQTGAVTDAGAFSLASVCTLLFQLTGEILIGALAIGLYRTVRGLAVGGPGTGESALDILRSASRRYVHLLAVELSMAAALAVGALVCGVGALAAAFFLGLAPYLVAAREYELAAALRQSVSLARANPTTMIVAVVVGVVTVGVGVGIGAALTALLTSLLGAIGVFLASALRFLVGAVLGYGLLVFFGSVAVSIETDAVQSVT